MSSVEQFITDADLYRRVIATVDRAMMGAAPRRVFEQSLDGYRRMVCPWTLKTASDVLAARSLPGEHGVGYDLEVNVAGNADASTHLRAQTGFPGEVRWWPGADGLTVGEYMSWWERLVADTADAATCGAVGR